MSDLQIPDFENDGDMLAWAGHDAERWTALFERSFYTVVGRAIEGGSSFKDAVTEAMDPAPGDWLFGWFCNAMATAEVRGRNEGEHGFKQMIAPSFQLVIAAVVKQLDAGYDSDHDDQHTDGELALAAVSILTRDLNPAERTPWPFEAESEPVYANRKEELAMAAALCLAEIERIERLES